MSEPPICQDPEHCLGPCFHARAWRGAYWLGMLGFALAPIAATERAVRLVDRCTGAPWRKMLVRALLDGSGETPPARKIVLRPR